MPCALCKQYGHNKKTCPRILPALPELPQLIVHEHISEEEPVVEPFVEPIVEPFVEPIVEPFVEPFVEPVVKPVVEPVVAKKEPGVAKKEPVVEANIVTNSFKKEPRRNPPPSISQYLYSVCTDYPIVTAACVIICGRLLFVYLRRARFPPL